MDQYNDELSKELLASRIILIGGYVNSESASSIIFNLMLLDSQSNEPIQLYITSGGGSYLDVMAIYDTMATLRSPLHGMCIACASGYVALLLARCTKGFRYALTHSKITLQQPYGSLQPGGNQQTEVAIEAREVANMRSTYESLLSQTTGQPLDKVHADCESGMELKAEDAIAYGIIDEIVY